mgnify:FL=1
MTYRILYILFFVGMALSSCTPEKTHLTDYYYIYAPGEFYETYTLACKLASDNDSEIDSISYVKWNNQVIAVKRNTSSRPWFIVKAREDCLRSCNNDILMSNLSKQEVDSILGLYQGKFQEKYFE